MLSWLIQRSLHYRGSVILMAAGVFAFGLYSTFHANLDVFPEFAPPFVTIQTEAPGFSAEQVEALVTRAVEQAVNGTGSLDSLRSQSIQGLSIVTAVFRESSDIFRDRQLLGEQLADAASRLPQGVKTPRMTPLTSATMDLLKIGLVSDALSPMELRTFAQWTLRPRFLAVKGVATVTLYGGEVRQLQLQILPERLHALGLSIQDVVRAAGSATGVQPAGFVETGNQRIVIQTAGQSLTPAALGKVVLEERAGRPVYLGDVARIEEAGEPKFGDAVIQGRPGVLLTMLSQYGTNVMEVTGGVEAALQEMEPLMKEKGIVLFPRLHRPATFIENAIGNLEESLWLGAILVSVVLFLFLYNVRTAFISLTAIPLSLAAAMAVLHMRGQTLNTITLGGLAIALGEIVDDAIIDVENIFRRLRENAGLPNPRAAFRVVLDASLEVRSAVVFATFVVALVFLPILTMTGLQGRLFAPLGYSYLLAILASLAVATTVTPALSLMLLPRAATSAREFWLLRQAREFYRTLLAFFSRHGFFVLVIPLVFLAAALAVAPTLQSAFLPEFREGHFVLHFSGVPGTSLGEMQRLGSRLSAELLANPHIATVSQQIGRAELGEDPWGPERSEIHVELKPVTPDEEEQVKRDIRAALASFPGVRFDVLTFLGDRIGETITGETASVVVNVFGEDLEKAVPAAGKVARILREVPGAVDVQQVTLPSAPQMIVTLLPEEMARFGFRPVDVLDAVEAAYQGARVAQTHQENRTTDVVVILPPEMRREPEAVGGLLLRTPAGALVPLSSVAAVHLEERPYMLLHEGTRRRQTVTCNVAGRDVPSFVAEARRRVAKEISFPEGVYAVFGGTAEVQAAARSELFLHSALAALGILLLLSMVLGNRRNLILVLFNLPFALVGGVFGAALSGGVVSIGSLVGFVTLFGITTRNSIMLVSHFEHLVAKEGMTWGLEAALRGAAERFVPILMTATVTGLGLLPLALQSGRAGREVEGPMAAVILGGLITSTLLNLLVLPALALRFGRFEKESLE